MKKIESVVIPLPLAATKAYKDVTLNKYISAERSNRFAAASLKRQATDNCALWVKKAMNDGLDWQWPADLWFHWHVPNNRIDPDNIAFQKKFILDGMQAAKMLPNDDMKHIRRFHDAFMVEPAGHGYVEIKQERSE